MTDDTGVIVVLVEDTLCTYYVYLYAISSNHGLMIYIKYTFRTLRKLFKVDAADYMLSICGNDALRELSSPGKSGSFFYLTHDDKYMIKTIKKAEVKVSLICTSQWCNFLNSVNTYFTCTASLYRFIRSIKMETPKKAWALITERFLNRNCSLELFINM